MARRGGIVDISDDFPSAAWTSLGERLASLLPVMGPEVWEFFQTPCYGSFDTGFSLRHS